MINKNDQPLVLQKILKRISLNCGHDQQFFVRRSDEKHQWMPSPPPPVDTMTRSKVRGEWDAIAALQSGRGDSWLMVTGDAFLDAHEVAIAMAWNKRVKVPGFEIMR